MIDKTHFVRFANWTAGAAGRPQTFVLACAIIVGWALTGPLFDYSDTWQLVINTSTTIITFLMVFVIQNTQNRDTASLHIKLDELIRVTQKARNVLLNLEELDDGELERLHRDFQKLAKERPHLRLKRAESDETPPERSPKQ
jgi:low affinity Fe/Cu permease